MKLSRQAYRALAHPIETENFHLEPLGLLGALRVTNSWRHDPEILTAFFQSPKPRSIRKWFRSGMLPNRKNKFAFAIRPKGQTEPIGADIITLTGYRSGFGAIALHNQEWRGKGVVFETRAALINHFFNHGNFVRFYGSVEARNLASIFNYKRLGFQHAATWHRHLHNRATGDVLDLVYFELMKEAWENLPWREKTIEG